MKVLIWHVHGGYTDAFVRGRHEYLLPVNARRDAWGGGLRGRDWPAAREVPIESLSDTDVDVVVLQRPEEIALAESLTGRRVGPDLPAVYLEHNTPKPHPTDTCHPVADRDDITLVHVTHFNRLFWDNGIAPTRVVEHGVPDPGPLYTGELPRSAVVVNEPLRRGRVTGTDLLPVFGGIAPVDVFGMGTAGLTGTSGVAPSGDLPPTRLRAELARRRLYLHPLRWTSLGLALLEAMHLGMPVIGLATTEAPRAVPPEAGLFSNDLDELARGIRALMNDPALAAERGRQARRHVLAHYGLDAFLRTWDAVLSETLSGVGHRRPVASLPVGERSSR